jgi:S-DNA-T family DNA segregation ATPase FtsK/SpoIIIE
VTADLDIAVGRTVGTIVRREFANIDLSQGLPATMIAGFTAAEASAAVAELADCALPGLAEPVDLVVSVNDALSDIPDRYRLDRSARTMTWYRNNNTRGLVLIEVDAQGDQQGVVAMHTLTDADILDPQSAERTSRLTIITRTAWAVAKSADVAEPPQALIDTLSSVFDALATSRPLSLRRWVAFCLAASFTLAELDRAVTSDEVELAVARALPHLGLFPDSLLFERGSAVSRRLERNAAAAQLLTPQGKELREDELADLIDRFAPSNADGHEFDVAELESIRASMRAVRDNGGPEVTCGLEFSIWEQLFGIKAEKLGLGRQIRKVIEDHEPARLSEFDDLEIEAGLDEGDPAAAEKLLRAETDGEERLPLAASLPAATRKKLERLLFRGERVSSDPLITLLYGLKALDPSSDGELGSRTISLRLENPVPALASEALFGFLYGRTLAEIADACDGSAGNRFEVDARLRAMPDLAKTIAPPDPLSPDEEEPDGQDQWAALRFVLTTSDTRTPLIRFRWEPRDQSGQVAFARLVCDADQLGPASIDDLDDWLEAGLDRWSSPVGQEAVVSDDDDDLARDWRALRAAHFGDWCRTGLSASDVQEYLTGWEPLMREARTRYVPQGGRLTGLDRFLSFETASCVDGRSVMLATHPLRLRWLGRHLARLGEGIRRAIDEDLHLNPENDRLYFDWLEHVSPHRQPPILSTRSLDLQTSIREVGWHEEYGAVSRGGSRIPDWLSGVDDASVNELVGVARSFLEAFPQKSNGLSVLILARAGAASLSRVFVERLRQREHSTIDLELHVLTPLADHAAVGRALSHLDSDEGRGRALMPPFRLVLHDWDGESLSTLDDLAGRIDLALAPNLFGLHTATLEETRRNEESVGGHFDPWLDPTTHFRPPSAESINVSQVQLPPSPDPLLEAWSTLTVRRSRQAPVAAQDPSATDFITLQVQFDRNEKLFARLHSTALWVVTLDPFVGRDQIDALKNAPDVITVKSGVGKNETYTLVVSSSAGSEFVVRRLERRLASEFGLEAMAARSLSVRLYEIGRFVVPGLMLRAVGLGRTTEELLGLILARHAIDRAHPTPPGGDGIDYWISLDEHANWFGGNNQIRPDLLRIRCIKTEATTRIELLIVESKFRQNFDLGFADQQISRALSLMKGAFQPPGESPSDDAPFWRRELLSAIEELTRRSVAAIDLPAVTVFGEGLDESILRSDLRSGGVDFASIHGVVCAVAWADDKPAPPLETPAGHQLILMDRSRVLQALAEIGGMDDVGPATTAWIAADTVEPELAPSDHVMVEEAIDDSPVTADGGSAPRGTFGQFAPPDPQGLVAAAVMPPMSPSPSPQSPPDLEAVMTDRRRLHRSVLEGRYQRILDRLTQLQVKVRPPTEVDRYQEGPAFCVYRVVPEHGMATDRVTGRLDDLKLALELPKELNLRAYVDRGAVVFEVPKEPADRYFVTAQSLWTAVSDDPDALSVPIGEDIEGQPVSIDFSSADTPHLLIAGQTGSGKSVALEAILAGLCARKTPAELQLLLVDPKSTELVEFEGDPHLRGDIGWIAEDAIAILDEGIAEMERRYESFRSRRVRSLPDFNRGAADGSSRLPWWLIVLDEYADLTSDPDDRKAIEGRLKRLAQKGRAAGIHLIVATQKPAAEVISTVVRSNLPAQLGLRVKTAVDSRIILDESGAEALAGSGDAFLKTARGMQRLQCAKVD